MISNGITLGRPKSVENDSCVGVYSNEVLSVLHRAWLKYHLKILEAVVMQQAFFFMLAKRIFP